MFRVLLISCLLGLSLSAKKDYKICYKGKDESGNTCMTAEANAKAGTIYYHVLESPDYEDVETLENYNVDLAASRVASQEACYISRLTRPYETQVAFLEEHNLENTMTPQTDVKVDAIPIENPEEEIGSDLTNFCGDLKAYKLVKTQEEEQSVPESQEEAERRQISLTFTRCVLLSFIIMFRLVLISCLLGLSLAIRHEYQLCYKAQENGDTNCMSTEANDETNTIYYSIPESTDFEKVETLEDYNVELVASRVESQEACYVRRIVRTFEEQISYMESHKDSVMQTENDVKVTAIPLDNPEEEIGTQLANFCGDLPVYKLVKKEEETQVSEDEVDAERRQISITFTRCVLLCFVPVCYTTTLTLPTGTTITFGWFFFG